MPNEGHDRDDSTHYNEGYSNFRQANPYQGVNLGIGWILQSSNNYQSNSRCLKTKHTSQLMDSSTTTVFMDTVTIKQCLW